MSEQENTNEEQEMKLSEKLTAEVNSHTETEREHSNPVTKDDETCSEAGTSEEDRNTGDEPTHLLQEIKAQLDKIEEDETEKIDKLQNELLSLKELQEKINDDFNEKLKYDNHKEQLIDQLHKELQEYKADVLKSTITPIINDLIMVSDNIQKLVGNYRSTEEPLDGEEILTHLESVTLDIDNVLFRQGIEPYQCMGEKVEPLKQTISKTVKTGNEADVKKIAERLRKGYEWDDKIIRKEHVSVYVYDENMEVTEHNKDEGDNKNE